MGSKYAHIREAMTEGAAHGQVILKHAKDFAQETIVEGKEKVKEIVLDLIFRS